MSRDRVKYIVEASSGADCPFSIVDSQYADSWGLFDDKVAAARWARGNRLMHFNIKEVVIIKPKPPETWDDDLSWWPKEKERKDG